MNQTKVTVTNLRYYSDRLKRKLTQLRSAPAAVVEAPSGYGKTTAIRGFLGSGQLQNTTVCWFTAAEEAPASGFRRLCLEIGKIDSNAGQRLLKIELPNAANAGEACDALRSIECINETYLVIDNFQLLQAALPISFFRTLIDHGCKNLHIVMITQLLTRDMLTALSGCGVLHLASADLRLNSADIRCYYSLAGVNLSSDEADRIFSSTEGWIIAVYLQLCAYIETGSVSDIPGLRTLMEHLIWDALTEEQQVFLLQLSSFERVTLQQACSLAGCRTLPGYALDALNIPFIRYDPFEHCYEIHSLLSGLLLQERSKRGTEFERDCLLRAGDLCRAVGEAAKAFGFYMQLSDYERLLSLDLTGLIFEKIGEKPFYELALHIAQNCPKDIKRSGILSMLRVAWSLLSGGITKEFDLLMEDLDDMLKDRSMPDVSLLRAEWLLLSAWRRLPFLRDMTALAKQASVLFNGSCSRVILPSAPWCFGDYSQLAVFHTVPGEVDREADLLEEYLAVYSDLTGGHGTGADVLFRAEAAHYRGDLNEAEVLAYKAGFLAETKQQSIVQLGASLHLAEISVEKSDMAGWRRSISSMEKAASYPGQNNFVLRAAVELLRALLLNELCHQERIPDWLKGGEHSEKLPPSMWVNTRFVQLSYLMHEGEFARLAGLAEAARELRGKEKILADAFFSLLAAAGHISLENTARAEELLNHAAETILPDGFVYLLAVYYWMLRGMPEELVRRQYPDHLARFMEIKERFIAGFSALHTGVAGEELPAALTLREREVAVLAASGLRNSEIADKLMISENTVRFHLRTVFQKLDIDRRARLADVLK